MIERKVTSPHTSTELEGGPKETRLGILDTILPIGRDREVFKDRVTDEDTKEVATRRNSLGVGVMEQSAAPTTAS